MARHRRAGFVGLVQHLARTRPDLDDVTKAITNGRVLVDGRIVVNPAALIRRNARVTVQSDRVLRGTAKLHAALEAFSIPTTGRVALDLGASAGGFTATLLAAGARQVYAVDAGVGQLAGWLRQHPRVSNLEGVNVAHLAPNVVPDMIDVVTIDLSYLALAEAVPQLERLSFDPAADLVALVKPMFELGWPHLPPANATNDAVRRATEGIEAAPWQVIGDLPSPVWGRKGAVEWLLHARRYPDYIISP